MEKTLCNLCAMTCGLEMEVEDNRILSVRPDPASPSSDCYCCRKGRSAKYFVEDSERILYPQKRVGDHYERISWEQAYSEIAEKANAILKAHGPRSTAIIGGGGGATGAAAATAQPFLKAIGSQYFFNPIGVEFMGIFWSCGRIFGDQFHPLEPDDKNCEVLIFWGSNSYVSHQLPNARPMIRSFSQDPDKMVIVVDPRLSETARMADMHIQVRPGADSLFLRALIALIVEKGWQNRDFLYRYCRDWTQTRGWFADFDIDGALEVCGVSREQAERFAHILTTKKWGMHQDLGLYFGRQSTLSSYLCLVLMAVCGTLLVPGGNVPPVRIITLDASDEYDPRVWRMPVTGRFPVAGMYPEGALPDEVLGDNEDRIRMAFCNMSNPARSYPDSQKMEEALRRLELFVAMDCVETETTRLADYVLPTPSAYEVGGDFDVFAFHYPEIMYFSRRGVVKAPGEAREDAMIYAELTEAMGLIPKLPQYLYDAAEEAVRSGDRIKYFMKVVGWIAKGGMKYFDQAATIIALTLGKAMGSAGHAMCWAALLISKLPSRAIMDVKPDTRRHPLLALMPGLSEFCTMDAAFALVDQHPEGAVIAHSDTEHLMARHIKHKDKKFHLWCREIDEAIKTVMPEREREALTLKGGCNMILSAGRHSDGGMNTSMRNPGTYRFRDPYRLAMNPEDAAALGLEDGETARVTTKKGSIELPVEITWQTSRGYCMIPHHFGLSYEGKTHGMHINYLTDHQDLGQLASQGIDRLPVFRRPGAVLIPTGTELFEPGQERSPHGIYNSSSFTLSAVMKKLGLAVCRRDIVPDDAQAVAAAVYAALASDAQAVFTTGGASVGDFDFSAKIAGQLGAKPLFWKVNMKPGGALMVSTWQDKLLVNLSGNPAAAMMSLLVILRPWLERLCGMICTEEEWELPVWSPMPKTCSVKRLLRGHLLVDEGRAWFAEHQGRGNGNLGSFVGCDLIGVVPGGSAPLEKGDVIQSLRLPPYLH